VEPGIRQTARVPGLSNWGIFLIQDVEPGIRQTPRVPDLSNWWGRRWGRHWESVRIGLLSISGSLIVDRVN
jgi:hypothetical protein